LLRDFEVGRNVSSEESTVIPVRANYLVVKLLFTMRYGWHNAFYTSVYITGV